MTKRGCESLDKPRPESLTSWQRVGVRLVALGDELAAEIIRYLDDPQVEQVTQGIAELNAVRQHLQDEALPEFEQALRYGPGLSGGLEYAPMI